MSLFCVRRLKRHQVCTHPRLYACVCLCVCVYTCVCTCLCVYLYICVHARTGDSSIKRLVEGLPVRDVLCARDGVLGVWVTNDPHYHSYVVDELFPLWGVSLVGVVLWVKVTCKGDPVIPFHMKHHRRPYEKLIIGCVPALLMMYKRVQQGGRGGGGGGVRTDDSGSTTLPFTEPASEEKVQKQKQVEEQEAIGRAAEGQTHSNLAATQEEDEGRTAAGSVRSAASPHSPTCPPLSSSRLPSSEPAAEAATRATARTATPVAATAATTAATVGNRNVQLLFSVPSAHHSRKPSPDVIYWKVLPRLHEGVATAAHRVAESGRCLVSAFRCPHCAHASPGAGQRLPGATDVTATAVPALNASTNTSTGTPAPAVAPRGPPGAAACPVRVYGSDGVRPAQLAAPRSSSGSTGRDGGAAGDYSKEGQDGAEQEVKEANEDDGNDSNDSGTYDNDNNNNNNNKDDEDGKPPLMPCFLEVFGRELRPGWVCVGEEALKFQECDTYLRRTSCSGNEGDDDHGGEMIRREVRAEGKEEA
eukprot:GHVU01064608.1.p1 GENE.GHVU01064608.1~~GHVU01064608.1.p1  ORF type:complete len:531 (+),score=86.14 GHVU01064608.1:240-1832(+)